MQLLGFAAGAALMTDSNHHYTATLAGFTFHTNPDGSEHTAVILTAELTSDDGGPPCQASIPLLGGAGAQRIMARVLVAKGRAATLAAAVVALRAEAQAAGGDLELDPQAP